MASNTRQIRRQIKSIKNTAKITRAMEMISAVKLQKRKRRLWLRALIRLPPKKFLKSSLWALRQASILFR